MWRLGTWTSTGRSELRRIASGGPILLAPSTICLPQPAVSTRTSSTGPLIGGRSSANQLTLMVMIVITYNMLMMIVKYHESTTRLSDFIVLYRLCIIQLLKLDIFCYYLPHN